jgi:hypothetical protein
MAVAMDDGSLLQIDALGEAPPTFRIDIWGRNRCSSHEITDNFSMFRRTLWHFAKMIRTGRPVVPVQDTMDAMRLLIAGKMAVQSGKRVMLSELSL